ncbi:hypothetical protein D2V93_08470 [Flagellimonas taeanensis]|uniref:hypothetical protein n=1 Tax=Flagellimonas taeanensis TaxID=1005926 RepID=UPI000E67795A|nr:hypothetical protein [Allomuricauda taeanensis]RIV50895.1 hypothetical protein D2V93_08470 [Allomuricauda taeanensis]
MVAVEKEVKEVLLYVDKFELNGAKARAEKAEKALNDFIRIVEGQLQRQLNGKEFKEVKDDALNWLETALTFPLSKAPKKLRYEALNIDIAKIERLWEQRSWERYEFDQVGNAFKLKNEQPIYNTYRHYATPRQLEVLEQTKALADALNLAAEQGLNSWKSYHGSHTEPMHKVKDTFRVLRYDQKEDKVVPDLEIISRMK